MINRATDDVSAGRYRSAYGHILADEFQDISPGRAALLKVFLDQSPTAQLFAVGDDWQAIFRFAGSDITVMREFEQRFGSTGKTKRTPIVELWWSSRRGQAETATSVASPGRPVCCSSRPTVEAYNGGTVDGPDHGGSQTTPQVLQCASVTQLFLDNRRPLVD